MMIFSSELGGECPDIAQWSWASRHLHWANSFIQVVAILSRDARRESRYSLGRLRRRLPHEPFPKFKHTVTGEMILVLVCRLEIGHGHLPRRTVGGKPSVVR